MKGKKNIILNQLDIDDVEKEDINGEVDVDVITKPFKPDDIDVDIATVNLGSVIEQLENEEIDFQPDFQRATDVWDNTKKSRLIESILLGLPLPSFYFSEDAVTKKLSVIDGLQRLCAIRDFILKSKDENPLVLQNLQFLKNFEGKTYSELERPDIRRIKALKITMNVLRKTTPNEVKFIIFQRVNTAGEPLTQQEMRHALNQGDAASFIKELAEMDSFIKATKHSVKTKRMEDRDFANRFIAFYMGYEGYNGELDAFLNDQMGELNRMSQEQRESIRQAFDKSMVCCYQIFGDDSFRRRLNKEDSRKPISKAVYDTLSVNVAWLTDEERNKLVAKADIFKEGMMKLFNDKSFNFASSAGTGKKSSVELRFTRVKELIKKIIES
ncbi:DUF262 domain-containing protein [uncultured Parabacteroides sp.]|uniref:DUF262 domain-containing protein n=1 Tax=Parabacteroides sp. ASD2025 TaxID=3415987 RepID=UPI002658100B|nr:DUF262 domain-containing protein [uncultured Parabacteroides sp.]